MGSRGSVIFALCLAVVSGQFPLKDGKCPNFSECGDPVEATVAKISNIWYQKYSIDYFFQENKKCTHLNFVATSEPNMVTFEKTEYDNS